MARPMNGEWKCADEENWKCKCMLTTIEDRNSGHRFASTPDTHRRYRPNSLEGQANAIPNLRIRKWLRCVTSPASRARLKSFSIPRANNTLLWSCHRELSSQTTNRSHNPPVATRNKGRRPNLLTEKSVVSAVGKVIMHITLWSEHNGLKPVITMPWLARLGGIPILALRRSSGGLAALHLNRPFSIWM